MGLDDLFKQRHHSKSSHHDHDDHHYEGSHNRHDYNDDHGSRQGGYNYHGGHHKGHLKLELIRTIFQSLPHKKALLAGALIIGIIMLITGIALLWALFPLITQTVGYVEANGIKSIVDGVLPYVEKLWKGNG
jgi:cytochrome b subunit of formate dehydrogenase